jgi:large subunit ribosomal protein L17
MIHQSGNVKLNLKSSHRRAFLRNQVIHLITYGSLTTTKANVKEVRRLAEKVVTIAREGNHFNVHRKVKSMLPYKQEALKVLFTDIAPKYVGRPGGYTRIINLGQRSSDTSHVARLEWV